MDKIITIKKSDRDFFRAYVEIIKPFLNKITNKESDILAELLYQNYLKQNINDKSDRFKVILNSENRRNVETKLNITSHTFRNALTSFKAKRITNDKNEIKDEYLIIPTDNIKIIFNFIIDKE